MLSMRGLGEGEALGVGDGVAIEWPVCCPTAAPKASKETTAINKDRSIVALPH
jgi:hypothetical protein